MPDAASKQSVSFASATDILHFEKWLSELGERKATDLHLSVGNVPMLRLNGVILPMNEEEVVVPERLARIVDYLLNDEEKKRLEAEKEIIASKVLKKVMRFRLHVFFSRGFLSLSLRHVSLEDRSAESLGLPAAAIEFAKESQGLVIVTGPFDSGRTSTVNAFLSYINHNFGKYIVTLEEPVENLIPADKSAVTQREAPRDMSGFAAGLAKLRDEDADVVALSRLPDKETAIRALELANSGRLVFVVMDSRDSLGALETFRDIFAAAERQRVLNLLAGSLIGVVAQLLIPKVGGGRLLVCEILRATNPLRGLIRDNKLAQILNIMQTAREEGMITMDKALVENVKLGRISLADAQARAVDKNQFNLSVSH